MFVHITIGFSDLPYFKIQWLWSKH